MQESPTVRDRYAERLSVPLRWWVQGTMLIATLWLAVVVAAPPIAAHLTAFVCLLLMTALFVSYGGARVVVVPGTSGGELRAGRAHIALSLLGPAEALDAEATRRVAGRDADARAYLLLRPYLKRAVRVDVRDPADPTPYWLVGSRHPEQLADAIMGTPR